MVEAGIAYGGKAGKANGDQVKTEILRFANRTPLLFDAGACIITKVVNELDWSRYGLKDMEKIPLSIFVNITSTYIPYTSAGKQAIADEEEIRREIALALMDVARNIKQDLSRERRKYEKQTRRMILARYVPEVAKAVSDLSGDKKNELEIKLMELVNSKYGEIEEEEEPKKRD